MISEFDSEAIAFPPFATRAPWWGADLQTLKNAIIPPKPLRSRIRRRLYFSMHDDTGDQLTGLLDDPETLKDPGSSNSTNLPMIVLIHGLSGSEESAYILSSTRFWLARGHSVLRLNLRGAGPSRPHCLQQYHAGRSGDLRAVLEGLEPDLLDRGLILIGYSLGGNMLLKFMAESAEDFPILAAASVSAPIDLAAASRRFLDLRNWVYHRHLLSSMKKECFGGRKEIGPDERQRILASRTIYQFDDDVVAPRNGFRDATHYYHENNSRRVLEKIRKPTLLLHALDDPWIPRQAYTNYAWQRNPMLIPLLSKGGGHVGFHARRDIDTYYDHSIGLFVDRLLAA